MEWLIGLLGFLLALGVGLISLIAPILIIGGIVIVFGLLFRGLSGGPRY